MSLIISSIAAIMSTTLVFSLIGLLVGYIVSENLSFLTQFDLKIRKIMFWVVIMAIIGLIIVSAICLFVIYREKKLMSIAKSSTITPSTSHSAFGVTGGLSGNAAIGSIPVQYQQQQQTIVPSSTQSVPQYTNGGVMQQAQAQQQPIIRYY